MSHDTQSTTETVFVTGLKNAHAVEEQALTLMDRQLERLENYPLVAEKLQLHRSETEQQIARLEELLAGFDSSSSAIKDAMTTFSANMASLFHGTTEDEILKNTFANFAFENYEIASYKSLISLAEAGGYQQAIPALKTTLSEEEAMADWIGQNVPDITRKYLSLEAADEKAGR